MTDRLKEGTLMQRPLGDGRELVVHKMMFTYRLCIGSEDGAEYDDAWCYDHISDALLACEEWDGVGDDPPHGWHRHIGTGRRRPNGDSAREYVQK